MTSCPECGQEFDEAGGACPFCTLSMAVFKVLAEGSAEFSIPIPEFQMEPPEPKATPERCLVNVVGRHQGPTDAPWRHPFSVATAGRGLLYVFDRPDPRTYRLVRYEPEYGSCSVVSILKRGMDFGDVLDPHGVALGPDGRIYIPNAGLSHILVLSPDGEPLAKLGSQGMKQNEFNHPQDVDVGRDGSIYVADTLNSRISILDPEGHTLFTVGRETDVDFDGYLDPGDGPGEFYEPQGITAHSDGRIFVCDTYNHRIQVLDPSGEHMVTWGDESIFEAPSDIRVSGDGTMYVADRLYTRIRIFSPEFEMKHEFDLRTPQQERIVPGGDIAVVPPGLLYVPNGAAHELLEVEFRTESD